MAAHPRTPLPLPLPAPPDETGAGEEPTTVPVERIALPLPAPGTGEPTAGKPAAGKSAAGQPAARPVTAGQVIAGETTAGEMVDEPTKLQPPFGDHGALPRMPVHSMPDTVYVDYNDEETVAGELTKRLGGFVVAGRYRFEEPIGEGGMGRVFRVTHLRLGKSFALKLMRANFSGDPRLRELFYREARLASSLAHPNVVSIIDFGEDPRIGAYMVMELLDGEPLSNRMRGEGSFPLRLALETILQIAEALHYIHGRGIVHCDIKPDNILLCSLPGTERRRWQVKLLDFGLARPQRAQHSKIVDGTPAYLAPERIRGLDPDPSMDIYSLGVLCYEMLTGELPFGGTITEIMEAHVRLPPPPLSSRMREKVDERVEALVMRALEKDPRQRQRDMAAFIYELRTLMDMLGFGRRRGASASLRVLAAPLRRREKAGFAAFEASPLPMATFSFHGTIQVANRAFARFMTGDKNATVEGSDIYGTKLIEVHPEFSADLRHVHIGGAPLSRTLHLQAQDGSPVNLMLWMVPAQSNEEGGDVHVTIHSLDAPDA